VILTLFGGSLLTIKWLVGGEQVAAILLIPNFNFGYVFVPTVLNYKIWELNIKKISSFFTFT